MKDNSIPIHMEEKYFDCSVGIVFHIFQEIHLLLIPPITYYIIEWNSILSKFYYFVQEIVLLIKTGFHCISRVNIQFYS